MTKIKVQEIQDPQGGRNMIRSGDAVRISANAPFDATGFKARFINATVVDGKVVEITVVGGRGYNPALPPHKQAAVAEFRTLRPCRVHRLSQADVARKADIEVVA